MPAGGMADYLQEELMEFLHSMKNPDDLLSYGLEHFSELAAPRNSSKSEDARAYFEPQTDFGQFMREITLALKSLQFEVLVTAVSPNFPSRNKPNFNPSPSPFLQPVISISNQLAASLSHSALGRGSPGVSLCIHLSSWLSVTLQWI